MKVKEVFKQPVNDWYDTNIRAGHFEKSEQIDFETLIPNHDNLDDLLIIEKMLNPSKHTDILVVKQAGNNYLINGHHTAVAQILNGYKYLMCKVYNHPIR